ncbi:cysteine desulfurase family protein [Microbacterium sp. STN6]|uniref:cysteine desulfurase family protein n=1 Tax=Microbacterium sp. STN6 TaxID=2995588 RepID=UPI002260C24A|nr:cysteine desulfurase family protein [Microbacterium sp. STN6]MCX7522150.1 cysteine desulfurase family protein [Microbacterium sp. STN6]
MTVYLDHAATTPMLPESIEAYARAMALVGNPSSIHSQGQQARRMLEEARERVAATLGCDAIEVVFTSGGTESINLAVKGLYWARNRAQPGVSRPRILAPGGEHHATLDTVTWLEQSEGAAAEWLPLDELGRIRLDALESALEREPASIALLTLLWANNEVGTIQPVERIAALAAGRGVPMHVDAVAAYGHVGIDVRQLRAASGPGAAGLVALSVSAHKIGGPVGIGALVLSRQASVVPLLHGGGQQRQVRSGTQDVAAAVAFAVAAEAAEAAREAETARLAALRDRLVAGVLRAVPEARLSGVGDGGADAASARLAMNAHFTFPGAQGDSLLFLLDAAGVSVSTGSACQAGVPEPSHVLLAMGRSERDARSALRMTLGRTTTDSDVDAFLAALPQAYARASRAGLSERTTRLGAR